MANRGTALVTGGGYGLGAAIAQKFGEVGYDVVIAGRSEATLKAHAARLQQDGIVCSWRVCDVSDWDSVVAVTEYVESTIGPISVLVNNAGGWTGESVESIDPWRVRELIGATILGTTFFCKAVIPGMKRQGSGFVLNIGSVSALPITRDSAVASSTKAAVQMFTMTLARELRGSGIRVAVLHPASIDKEALPEEAESSNQDGSYLSISPRQVADVAAYMVHQPPNIVIRELLVTPSDAEV